MCYVFSYIIHRIFCLLCLFLMYKREDNKMHLCREKEKRSSLEEDLIISCILFSSTPLSLSLSLWLSRQVARFFKDIDYTVDNTSKSINDDDDNDSQKTCSIRAEKVNIDSIVFNLPLSLLPLPFFFEPPLYLLHKTHTIWYCIFYIFFTFTWGCLWAFYIHTNTLSRSLYGYTPALTFVIQLFPSSWLVRSDDENVT